jgi:hypothetical protein
MKFGKACRALRYPDPGSNIERLPCYTGIDNEKAFGNSTNPGVPMASRKTWQEFGEERNCLRQNSVTH